MKLLYAEDEETMAEAVVDILTYHNYLVDTVADGAEALAYAGILDLLKSLKDKGYKMAIVSNKAQCAVSELNEIYFKKYIDVAIGENEAGGIGKKPAPDEVNLALEQLDSTKAESIYVGDSDVDKATADNSQLDCVLCQWGFRDLELLESLKPKSIIAKPEELIEVLEG